MDSQATVSERLAYPVSVQSLSDTVLVSFPDVPEALTEGDTEQEALDEAYDCLVAALAGYIHAGRPIPNPSGANHSPLIELSPIVTAKLALYRAMREQQIDDVILAKRLGTMEITVNRLLDLDYRSHIDHVAAALDVLGKRLVVAVHPAA